MPLTRHAVVRLMSDKGGALYPAADDLREIRSRALNLAAQLTRREHGVAEGLYENADEAFAAAAVQAKATGRAHGTVEVSVTDTVTHSSSYEVTTSVVRKDGAGRVEE